MKREKWHEYVFEDGHKLITKGLSRNELAREELRHGKLISKKEVYV